MPKEPAAREVSKAANTKAKPISGQGKVTKFPTPTPGQVPFYRGSDGTPSTKSNT